MIIQDKLNIILYIKECLTMPQKPGLYTPTPPAGQILDPLLSHSTSIRSATLLRMKQDVRSVDTIMFVSFPIMDHGYMFEGVLGPPSSKPGNEFVLGFNNMGHKDKQTKLNYT